MDSLQHDHLISIAEKVSAFSTTDLANLRLVNRGCRDAVREAEIALSPSRSISDAQLVAACQAFPRTVSLALMWSHNLAENTLSDIPNLLPNLHDLTLAGRRLPLSNAGLSNMLALTRLQSLQLQECNKITAMPLGGNLGGLSGWTAVKRLSVTNCLLFKDLTEGVCDLVSLRDLKLHKVRNVTKLPNAIGGLSLLTCLYLGCSSLRSLPDSVGGLTSLERLDLKGCQLKLLPESIRGIVSLRHLHLEGLFSLKKLPEGLGYLTALETLEIRDCAGLAALPEGLGGLVTLRELRVTGCGGLAALPESLGGLVTLCELRVTGCGGLAALPESLGGLITLRELRVTGCGGLAALPGCLGRLSALRLLDLSGCAALREVPEACFSGLSCLRTLDLYGCSSLDQIPEGLSCLTGPWEVNLIGCSKISVMPDSFTHLTSVRILYLVGG